MESSFQTTQCPLNTATSGLVRSVESMLRLTVRMQEGGQQVRLASIPAVPQQDPPRRGRQHRRRVAGQGRSYGRQSCHVWPLASGLPRSSVDPKKQKRKILNLIGYLEYGLGRMTDYKVDSYRVCLIAISCIVTD